MNPKISVVIPVYNAEDFLSQCLSSVLDQTLNEIEVIVIDDGSSDTSNSIIQKYAEIDSRIRSIEQPNQGVSIARNKGIMLAKGEYIGFMDSDDFVAPDFFETLYNQAITSRSDIVVSRTILGRDGKQVIKNNVFPPGTYDKTFINTDIIPNLIESEDLFAVWNKIYKRDILKDDVLFPRDIVREEDAIFNISAFLKASSVTFVDYAGYFYRERENSVSREIVNNDFFEIALKKFHFNYKEYFNLKIEDDKLRNLKTNRFIRKVVYILFYLTTNKNYSFNSVVKSEVDKVLSDNTLDRILTKNKYTLPESNIFEKVVTFCIANNQKNLLLSFLFIIRVVYRPQLSEILRKLNFKS